MRKAAGVVVVAMLLMGARALAAVPSVSALPSVDLNRFAGSWYEIARLPSKREKGCIADVVDLVALAYKKDHLQLVSSCMAKNDYTDVSNASIKADKNSGGAKLKITYLWPFSDKEWILALGPDYGWVLMGSPNHKTLRVLSRDRVMSAETFAEIKQKAAAEGYDVDKLKKTLQTQR